MCLGIPGKVVEINDDGPLRMGKIDFGGVRKEACLAYVPEVVLGEYVIVHVGFAISKLDEDEALKTLELLRMIDADMVDMELGSMFAPDGLPATAAQPAAAPPAASA
ncbi:MAG TPA: HypC/HybG/HupF family hydrogenase formation chaperone [Candidatus Limnocylindrales bacterium]